MAQHVRKSSHKLLKCFCNCSELTRDEVQIICMMRISGFVNHEMGKKLFRSYLKVGHRTDQSTALSALNCYELAVLLLENKLNRTDENYEQLIELCPSYSLEKKLTEAIDDGTATNNYDSSSNNNDKGNTSKQSTSSRNTNNKDDSDSDDNGSTKNELEKVLKEIMFDCKLIIENHRDYKNFHKRLMEKLN